MSFKGSILGSMCHGKWGVKLQQSQREGISPELTLRVVSKKELEHKQKQR